jgi:hypothetical protein
MRRRGAQPRGRESSCLHRNSASGGVLGVVGSCHDVDFAVNRRLGGTVSGLAPNHGCARIDVAAATA